MNFNHRKALNFFHLTRFLSAWQEFFAFYLSQNLTLADQAGII